jgi:hypothetical protein
MHHVAQPTHRRRQDLPGRSDSRHVIRSTRKRYRFTFLGGALRQPALGTEIVTGGILHVPRVAVKTISEDASVREQYQIRPVPRAGIDAVAGLLAITVACQTAEAAVPSILGIPPRCVAFPFQPC